MPRPISPRTSGVQFEVKVVRRVSLTMHDMTTRQCLDKVAKLGGLVYFQDGNTIVVDSTSAR